MSDDDIFNIPTDQIQEVSESAQILDGFVSVVGERPVEPAAPMFEVGTGVRSEDLDRAMEGVSHATHEALRAAQIASEAVGRAERAESRAEESDRIAERAAEAAFQAARRVDELARSVQSWSDLPAAPGAEAETSGSSSQTDAVAVLNATATLPPEPAAPAQPYTLVEIGPVEGERASRLRRLRRARARISNSGQ